MRIGIDATLVRPDRLTGIERYALSMTAAVARQAPGQPEAFNREVEKYQDWLAANTPADTNLRKVHFESYLNHFAPFYHSLALYLAAFLLSIRRS